MDIQDVKSEVSRLRTELALERRGFSSSGADAQQDRKIADLEAEVDELRLYLSILARVLVRKGVMTRSEVGELVNVIDGHSL